MRLLLDSHIVIWAATDETALSAGEHAALAGGGLPVVSAVSIWETRLKWNSFHASGERKGIIAPHLLLGFVEAMGWPLLAISARHAGSALAIPLAHRDPFDELLLVQAQVEGLRLLTRDRLLCDHPLALLA